jgi:lipopolysaccharide export system permease protein
MRAELNKRLVYILTLPILPFLAVPFAVGHSRNQRSYRFGVAMVLIIVFHEVIEQGSLAVKTSGFSPLWSVWLPFALLVAFAGWRFYNAAYRLGKDRVEGAIELLGDGVSAAAAAITRPFRRKAAA